MCGGILPTFAHWNTCNVFPFSVNLSEVRPFCLIQTHLQDQRMTFGGNLNSLQRACSCRCVVQQDSGYAKKTTGCFSQPAQSAPHREPSAQVRLNHCWAVTISLQLPLKPAEVRESHAPLGWCLVVLTSLLHNNLCNMFQWVFLRCALVLFGDFSAALSISVFFRYFQGCWGAWNVRVSDVPIATSWLLERQNVISDSPYRPGQSK